MLDRLAYRLNVVTCIAVCMTRLLPHARGGETAFVSAMV